MSKKNKLNPFIGLRSFDKNESHLFFGRETPIRDIRDNLKRTNFSAVIGYSGSGKTSLIKSGLIPALKKTKEEEWKISFCTPGYNTARNLAKALINTYDIANNSSEEFLDDVERLLIDKNLSLNDTLLKLDKKNTEKCLIIIDQFEEFFNLSKKEDLKKSTQFINLILDAIKNKENNIYVILTLRSDFIGNCAEFIGLPEVLNQSQYLIPRLNLKQFEEVINGPLDVVNYKISNDLSKVLIKDIANNQDQLAILQHAMMRTIEYWKSHSSITEPIGIDHYTAVGTMKKALSNHADEAYNELNETEKEGCEKLFKALTNFNNNSITRNPLEFGLLVKITGIEPLDLLKIINTFRSSDRSFIYPKEGVEIKDSTIIDISHESLLRLWTGLQSWTKEEMESSETYKDLCETAKDYQEGRGSLLSNPELAIILKWREKQLPTEEWAKRYNISYPRALNFLEDSKIKFDQELLRKSLAQSKKAKLNKLIISFMSIALIVCIALGVFAFLQKEEAFIQKEAAEQQTAKANVNEKLAKENAKEATEQKRLAQANETLAMENATEATEQTRLAEDNATLADKNAKEAEEQTRLAQSNETLAKENATEAKEQTRLAKDNAKLADKNAKEATRLKNVSDAIKTAFESEKNLDLDKIDSAIVQSKRAHNLFITNGNLKRENQIYSALNRSLFEGKSKKDNFYNNRNSIGISTINQSNSSHEFMSFDNSRELLFFKVDDTNNIIPLNVSAFKNIDLAIYSTNGEFIICTKQNSTNSGELLIYNEKSKQLIKRFTFPNPIRGLQSFKYLNQQYISFKENGNSFLLNLNTLKYNQFQNTDNNDLFSFSEKGRYLISKKNNIALLYQVTFNQSLPSLKLIKKITSSSNITSYQFSKDDNMLALGTQEGTVLIYNTNDLSKVEISKHKNVKISDLDFVEINNQDFIISASYDNTINLINIENQDDFVTLKGHKSWVKSITVDQENKILYSVSEDASFRYWYLDQNALENQLKN